MLRHFRKHLLAYTITLDIGLLHNIFRSNGEPTIVTRDPEFQDVIGQRRTFSYGDSTKINRMYNCSKIQQIYHGVKR